MTIDITKPLVRRDGIAVDWIHAVMDNRCVYGFTNGAGYQSYEVVYHDGCRYLGTRDTTDDISNVPEYEYANVYSGDGIGSYYWYPTRKATDLQTGENRIGYLRRPLGSTDIREYELIPLEIAEITPVADDENYNLKA